MAAKKMRDALQGKKVVSVMTGGNIDTETLRKILQRPTPSV
jgi:threonine dehydratase